MEEQKPLAPSDLLTISTHQGPICALHDSFQDQALEFLSHGNQDDGVGGKNICGSHSVAEWGQHPDSGAEKCCQLSLNL